jgi:hypothetical protein
MPMKVFAQRNELGIKKNLAFVDMVFDFVPSSVDAPWLYCLLQQEPQASCFRAKDRKMWLWQLTQFLSFAFLRFVTVLTFLFYSNVQYSTCICVLFNCQSYVLALVFFLDAQIT